MKQLISYFMVTIVISLVDMTLSIFLFHIMECSVLVATNIGIIIGFILQYNLTMRYAFRSKTSIRTLVIFLLTWGIGVVVANVSIYLTMECVGLSFGMSKVVSMGASFFITYSMRKKYIEKRSNE